jgi:hypothetical protein
MSANPRIIGFLSGEEPDSKWRMLREIQDWPDARLEDVHDFIQWMFPLTEPSPVNPEAPVLDPDTIREIRSRPEIQQNARRSIERMRAFYERSGHWITPGNHNHLRITRILKSLRLMGLDPEAEAFFTWLSEIFHAERSKTRPGITARSFDFWTSAMK